MNVKKKIVSLVATALLTLSMALPVAAGKVTATATVTIDNSTPQYGDFVNLTAVIDGAGTTQMRTICTHEFGQSYGHSIITEASVYSDDIGLYAPNWPSGGATCVTNAVLLKFNSTGRTVKSDVIGSLTFQVAP